MPRYTYKKQPELLKELLENYTVPDIKKLAGLVASNLPTRKAELVTVIRRHLENPENLQKIWTSLDSLQQAAVAEVVHSPSLTFEATCFRAKYGQNPDWGKMGRFNMVPTDNEKAFRRALRELGYGVSS